MTIEHQHGIMSEEAIVGSNAAAAAYIAPKNYIPTWSRRSSELVSASLLFG